MIDEDDVGLSALEYWDARYTSLLSSGDGGAVFEEDLLEDWYVTASECPELQQILRNSFHDAVSDEGKRKKVLISGAGTSTLPFTILSGSTTSGLISEVVNTDISPVAVKMMQSYVARLIKSSKDEEERESRLAMAERVSFVMMDATDMSTITDTSFDVLIDKGTIDAIGHSGLNPKLAVGCAMGEYHRVLREKGVLVLMSFEEPEEEEKNHDIESSSHFTNVPCDVNKWTVVSTHSVPVQEPLCYVVCLEKKKQNLD
jgi:SAM-dependent methyltransferase